MCCVKIVDILKLLNLKYLLNNYFKFKKLT